MMKIALLSILVDDQEKALDVYTRLLGFEKKMDIPMGEFRWLTVTAAGDPEGAELVLEPNAHPAAQTFQRALYEDGIPATSFASPDVAAEYRRLTELGIEFRSEPFDAGGTTIAVFDDRCGNLVQIHQG
jgi:catechol 2,3-dioxygenase-like lactoylglutathione lyase family enzyme